MRLIVPTLCLLIILCVAPAGHAHRFYASFTQINVEIKKDTLEITHRLFTHDVEDMLSHDLGPISDLTETDIEKYLRRHIEKEFSLYGGAGQKLPLSWVGYEYNVDEILVYQEAPFKGAQTKFSLTNRLMMDIFKQQKNTVNIQRQDVVKTIIFQNDSGRKAVDFK